MENDVIKTKQVVQLRSLRLIVKALRRIVCRIFLSVLKTLALSLSIALIFLSKSAFAQAPGKKNSPSDDTFLSIVFSGGWSGILIMICLILLSLLAVYLIVEQAMFLRRKNIAPQDLGEGVKQLLAQGKVKDADVLCRSNPCPLAFVIVNGFLKLNLVGRLLKKHSKRRLPSKRRGSIARSSIFR